MIVYSIKFNLIIKILIVLDYDKIIYFFDLIMVVRLKLISTLLVFIINDEDTEAKM